MSRRIRAGAQRVDASCKIRDMGRTGRIAVAALALFLPTVWAGVALAADSPPADPPVAAISRSIPDLHLSISEVPGETTVRLPLASESLLYRFLSPYLSLASSTSLGVPWNPPPAPGLRRETDSLDDVRLGAGMAVPISERVQLYGEYRFLRGRLESGVGRSLLQREPDSADFRAGFSIRLD